MEDQKQTKKDMLLKAILNEGMAKTKDVAEAIKVVLGVVRDLKQELEQKMADNKGEMDTECEAMMSDITEMEKRMSLMHAKMSDKMGVDKKEVMSQCMTEIAKCKEMIPEKADFTEIENKLKELEKKIPTLPPEITPDQIADKLNTLEEAVDMEVIKGLKKKLEDLEKKWTSRPMFGGGGLSKFTADTLYAPIGGGGTGFTTLTATGTVDGSNTTFTFTQKPTFAIIDGVWYIENTGWTWVEGTLTLTTSVPPQMSIWGFV